MSTNTEILLVILSEIIIKNMRRMRKFIHQYEIIRIYGSITHYSHCYYRKKGVAKLPVSIVTDILNTDALPV